MAWSTWLKIACSQEEYTDTNTLESRLQDVARRMVSHQGRGRQEAGRPPVPPTVPEANGFAGPDSAPGHSFGAGTGFGSGGQVSQLLNQPARGLQQNGFLRDAAPGQQTALAGLTTGGSGSFPVSQGPTACHQSRGAPSPQPGPGTSVPMSSPAVPKSEPGAGALQLGPQYGARPSGPQPSSSLLQTPTLGAAVPPVMSNGAPVLLRGSRDWQPGPSPGLINVSCSPLQSLH